MIYPNNIGEPNAAFVCAVAHIVGLRAKKEVIRINAMRVIAPMAYGSTEGDRTICYLICHSMSQFPFLPANRPASISGLLASSNP